MRPPIRILGAGCTGPLLAIMLARQGREVHVYERRTDARVDLREEGRSINLALAARGLQALEVAGLGEAIRPHLIPMQGRCVHAPDGSTQVIPYGQGPHEVIWSVSRSGLNRLLLEAAERHGVHLHFQQACEGVDFAAGAAHMRDLARDVAFELPLELLLATDGAGSRVRASMVAQGHAVEQVEMLPHDYKELHISPRADGSHAMLRDALHLWPRGGYMLIALPNTDGSFTATLFMAATAAAGTPNFAALQSPADVEALFARDFPDVLRLEPDLPAQYFAHPTGRMGTVHVAPWHVGGQALLLGDAAHAIVPFHGQGMNCAFEDCVAFDRLLAADPDADPAALSARFTALRRNDTEAIAQMALENYVEMRDTVRDPRFVLQKQLSLLLERRHPDRFIPRYSMVMFHHEIPYSEAQRRGALQSALLDEATRGITRLEDVDQARVDARVRAVLAPFGVSAVPS